MPGGCRSLPLSAGRSRTCRQVWARRVSLEARRPGETVHGKGNHQVRPGFPTRLDDLRLGLRPHHQPVPCSPSASAVTGGRAALQVHTPPRLRHQGLLLPSPPPRHLSVVTSSAVVRHAGRPTPATRATREEWVQQWSESPPHTRAFTLSLATTRTHAVPHRLTQPLSQRPGTRPSHTHSPPGPGPISAAAVLCVGR